VSTLETQATLCQGSCEQLRPTFNVVFTRQLFKVSMSMICNVFLVTLMSFLLQPFLCISEGTAKVKL
jgi:hypothetical protein